MANISTIVQGDNGTVLSFTVKDGGRILDLTNATVQVTITNSDHVGNIKQAEITDAPNGKCQVILNSDDVTYAGVYVFQAAVFFSDGRQFTSNNMQKFTVSKKLGYIPGTGGGSGGNVNIFAGNNGHILVNGSDIKVYDDNGVKGDISTLQTNITNINNTLTQVNSDITELKSEEHTHGNKSALDRLGIDNQNKLTIDGVEIVGAGGDSVLPSSTNGDINVNGQDIKVYDDTSLVNLVNQLQSQLQDALNRISVLESEVSGGGTTNTAPSISSSYNTTSVYTNDNVSIPFTVTDAEGGTITVTYVIDGVSSTTSISTGANTWVVGTLSAGSHTLSIQVTDNGGLTSNTLTFNITSNITSNTATVGSATVGTSTVA